MAVSGFWYMSHVTDDEVRAMAPAFDAFYRRVQADPLVSRAMESWKAFSRRIYGPSPDRTLDPSNQEFLDAFWAAQADPDLFYSCARDYLDSETWDLADTRRPRFCRAVFCATAMVPPVSMLYIGLGPGRVQWLPGAFGTFALTSEEVAERADRLRHAHLMSPAERAAAVERMYRWLEVGNAPGFPVSHLLDAIPTILGSALEGGVALVGASAAL